MLPFFPTPYPDELFYGICARYHQRSGNPGFIHTAQDLFGNGRASVAFDLPTNIHELVHRLSPGSPHTVHSFINAHTMLPLYRPFLPIERVEMITLQMAGLVSAGNIHCLAGLTASRIQMLQFLRYCPLCLRDDERDYGEYYWHRSHQVAGVKLCYRHDTELLESAVALGGLGGRQSFTPLTPDLTSPVTLLKVVPQLERHRRLAHDVHWLLNQYLAEKTVDLGELQRRYLFYLNDKGFMSSGGRLDCLRLGNEFVGFYGEGLLTDLHCRVDPYADTNWLLMLARKPRKASHPICHLLLIRFLGLTPDEFLNHEPRIAYPFGNGPWPCLNPAAPHYRRAVIGACLISRNSETGAPVGTFVSKCGFTCSRTGPDKSQADRSKIGRMVEVGSVWEKRLLQLAVAEQKSLRETARQLMVDVHTIKKHLMHLTGGRRDVTPSKAQPDDVELLARRESWENARKLHPDFSLSKLRRLKGAVYIWLYRNDRLWLQSHRPGRVPPKQPKRRVDWNARDLEFSAQIERIAGVIKHYQEPLVQVSVKNIAKQLGAPVLTRKLHLLPLTRTKLNAVIESKDEFAIRRLKFAAERLKQRGERLVAWRLVKTAGLRPGYSDCVAEALECLINYQGGNEFGEDHSQKLAV